MRIAFALSACLCLAQFAFAQVPAGFVALYPFNNSAIDVNGNGNNGTLTSTSNDVAEVCGVTNDWPIMMETGIS